MTETQLFDAASCLHRLLTDSRASDTGEGEDLYLVGKTNGALEILYALGIGSKVLDLELTMEDENYG